MNYKKNNILIKMKHSEILSQSHYMAHHTMWYLVDLTEQLNPEKRFVTIICFWSQGDLKSFLVLQYI